MITPSIRKIEKSDNPFIAKIIRDTLVEFNANHPGTVYYDASTDALFELFHEPGSVYYVATHDGQLLGGAGIFPTNGLPKGTCELVKMYLLPGARGLGLGRTLIETCLNDAKELGYDRVYLETMPELKLALKVYEKMGFEYLDSPVGNTGHTGCKLWMIRNI